MTNETRPLAILFRLYFGRAIPAGAYDPADPRRRTYVEDYQVADFVRNDVSRLFPAGYSHFAGDGGWRDTETGITSREDTEIIEILGAPSDRETVRELATIYASRFRQQSVMVTETECRLDFVSA